MAEGQVLFNLDYTEFYEEVILRNFNFGNPL